MTILYGRLLIMLWTLLLGQIGQAEQLSRLWARTTLARPHLQFRHLNRMPPLLTKTLVIQGNAVDGIAAFDRQTGNQKWARTFKNGVEGGAAVSGDKVFFGANDGQFYCLHANTGETLWQYPLNSESLTQPLVRGSYVYHITGNNTLYAFEVETGRSLWVVTRGVQAPMTVRGLTAPEFADGRLYVGYSDGSFVSLNAENGRVLWSKKIGDDKKFNDIDASARVTETCVLVASYANALYCLDKNDGTITWRHDVGGFNPVFVADGKVYYPTGTNEIHILDEPSGKLLQKILLKGGIPTEISAYKNFIIYGESTGPLVIRDKDTLEVLGRFYPGRGLFARPTIDAEVGDIFIHSNDANLFKLKLQSSTVSQFPWSKNL